MPSHRSFSIWASRTLRLMQKEPWFPYNELPQIEAVMQRLHGNKTPPDLAAEFLRFLRDRPTVH